MTLEKILGYFGTYTAGVDGAVSSFQFEYLTSLGFAAIVIFLGHAIVKRSALLKKFAIPAPVVSGLLFSIAVAILKASGVMAFSFDVKTIQDLCQNIFFMCVGFGFSWKLIRHAGGKLCIMIAVAACLLITLQDVLGVLVGNIVISIPLCMKWQGLGAAIGTAVATLVGNVFLMNRYYYKHIGLNIPGFWRHISHLLPAMVLPTTVAVLLAVFVHPAGTAVRGGVRRQYVAGRHEPL